MSLIGYAHNPTLGTAQLGYFRCDCCSDKVYEGSRFFGQKDANTKMNVCDNCKQEYIKSLVEEGDKDPVWVEVEIDYDI